MPLTAPEPIEAVPGLPETDDLPSDPITPPAALAPLPELTLHQVRDDLRSLARVVDAAMDRLPQALEELLGKLVLGLTPAPGTLSPPEAGALQHLCDTLETFGARGLVVSGAPYAAQIIAKTPAGYTVSVAIQRTDGASFLESLSKLEAWLLSAGYTPAP